MKCQEAAELIDLYLEGTLPPGIRAGLERHLMQCATCGHEAQTLRQSRELLQAALPSEPAPPSLKERLMARLHEQHANELVLLPPDVSQRTLQF
jgi:anti-sigma factor (TIGR02949 family)